ncbi:MAG: hypothetical protein HWE10_07125 [Gammaproteobacteria bacterium]|nr:hypothetical protein [Gammaproteobacteria bacterium]
MLERQSKATEEMRAKWRKETVAERIERISLETYDICKGRVKYGPFKGLKLNRDTWWGRSDLGSQCLGLYEKEVLNLIVENGPYETFIDIGAADGYYAVGMLYSQLAKNAVCFEITQKGQEAIKNNWALNDSVGSIVIHGEADIKSITSALSSIPQKSLVLIDIEGFEFGLLQSDILCLLKNCQVIIEVHNWVDDFQEKYTQLLTNIAQFFDINPLERIERETTCIPELASYTDDNRLLVTSERRPCLMRFLHLTPIK